jgi:hypothetical protein
MRVEELRLRERAAKQHEYCHVCWSENLRAYIATAHIIEERKEGDCTLLVDHRAYSSTRSQAAGDSFNARTLGMQVLFVMNAQL